MDMHWVEAGGPCTMAVFCGHALGLDRVPWRYSVDMYWVETGGPCTMAVFCGHALG